MARTSAIRKATGPARSAPTATMCCKRLWRGVTDHHIIDHKFLVSAEARKLHALAGEQAATYARRRAA